MKHFYKYALLASTLFAVSNSHAGEAEVRAALQKAMPTVQIDSIQPAEVSGLQEVVIEGSIFYISDDGKYLLQGHVIDIEAKKDITEEKLASSRVKALKDMGENKMIVFKPKESKYKVSVFTDIDCGYCRKLHSEMDQYLAEGITIQYLFYPRAGKGSDSYQKAVSVWCAENRNEALTSAKLGNDPEKKECDNPVDAHMALGEAFEARGTPMIITEKGNVLPGYVPAKQLAQALAKE